MIFIGSYNTPGTRVKHDLLKNYQVGIAIDCREVGCPLRIATFLNIPIHQPNVSGVQFVGCESIGTDQLTPTRLRIRLDIGEAG